MWKKGKRILSCILALVLLVSMINGQQLFVQADSGTMVKKETTENKVAEAKGASSNDKEQKSEEPKSEGDNKKESQDKEIKNESEGTTEKKKEENEKTESKSEATTEARSESSTGMKGNTEKNSTEEKEGEKVSTEEKGDAEESSTEEVNEKSSTEVAEETSTTEENNSEEMPTTEEAAQNSENEPSDSQISSKVSDKEMEYIPQNQPGGVNIKAYAKAGVFPEGTILKVKKLGGAELAGVENTLKKEKVTYDGCLGYDISFYDKNGKEIEPENGSVRVVMQLSGSVLPEEADTGTLAIQHMEEHNGGYDAKKVASVSAGSVKVSANKIKAEYTVNSFSDFIVTYSYVNTSNWKKEVKFYINKYSYIANSTAGGSSTMKENFTGSVATATVTMPNNADSYNYTIEQAADGKSKAYIVLQGDKTGSAYDVDAKIRALNTTPYDGFSISSIPSDAAVLANIRSGSVDVQVNGKKVNSSDLTTDNFQVRWYVFKYNPTDQWHIDGILVPKSGRLQVTKTFRGLTKQEISTLKNAFEIDVQGTTTYGENQYSLSLDKGTTSDNGMTYTWTVDVYNTTYTVKEKNMNLENWTRETKYSVTPDSSVTTGRVTDATYNETNGFSITCVTKATDTGSSTNQSVALENQYTRKTVPLKLLKTVTADGKKTNTLNLKDLKFEIRDSENKVIKTILFSEFTKKSDGTYAYSKEADKFMKAGETYTITEIGTDADGYKFNNTEDQCSKKVTVKATDTETEVSFTNAYIQPTLIVKKLVAGNMSEKGKEFHFSLQFIKNNKEWTEKLKQTDGQELSAEKGNYNFILKDGESISLKVPYGYTYTVTETGAEEYKTYTGDNSTTKENYKDLEENADKKATETLDTDDSYVTFVNEKNVVPPTGISTTMTAWLVMTGVTFLLGTVFFIFEVRRKRFTV